jgi:hypothetical protein
VLADWTDEDRENLNVLLGRLNNGIEQNSPQLADPSPASQAKGASA